MAGPMMKFRSGGVSATVWENQRQDGSSYVSVKLSRSYRDKQTQDWKETSSFSVNELPVVAILARKAFETLALENGNGHAAMAEAAAVHAVAEPQEEGEAEEAVEERPRGRRRSA